MKIHVTQKHIDEGVRTDCENCPVAKAITEATKHHAVVDQDLICWTPYYRHDVPTPPAVREFIDRFDSGRMVEPFTFELEAA